MAKEIFGVLQGDSKALMKIEQHELVTVNRFVVDLLLTCMSAHTFIEFLEVYWAILACPMLGTYSGISLHSTYVY